MKHICVFAAVLAVETACGQSDPAAPKAPTGAGDVSSVSEDATPADSFVFSQKKEDAIDAAVLADAGKGLAAVSLYFGNSVVGACVNWDVRVTGGGVALADASVLDHAVQSLLKDDGSGTLSGKFQTNGFKPGIRVLATAGGKVSVKGTMSRCKSTDETDVSTSVPVQQRLLKDSFADTDDAGNLASLRSRVVLKKN